MTQSSSRRLFFTQVRNLCLASLPLACLVGAGCYRRVSYVSPEGRKVEIVNIGFDTRIGSLHAQTDSGSLRIENAESQALLSQRLAELAATLAGGGR